jgi:hypothetical protein
VCPREAQAVVAAPGMRLAVSVMHHYRERHHPWRMCRDRCERVRRAGPPVDPRRGGLSFVADVDTAYQDYPALLASSWGLTVQTGRRADVYRATRQGRPTDYV